ncbi:GntR family transcriptional regulator [Pseudoxanthomonas kalamensis DSM 18571]|uniref:aminotransferase-like domain-containing protein n=1 Tax=Pseudoxanthomonas kalamensis TaxID=289483 RepID=UPI001390B82D|nr:PLP-dependent aminotransferase family protein [Pseudoxanthomonas kalamensis]KAF1711456.1 GntR family transcriptional regulator [Pseudoxanthomonas kalamensis DSM 18571]
MKKASTAETIAQDIAKQILNGTLKKGEKLPSLREYARLYSHSLNTVVAAFEILAQWEMVQAHRGKGFFVRGAPDKPQAEDEPPQAYHRAIDTIWLMRQQLLQAPGESNLSIALPPSQWLADMRLDKFHRQITRSGIGGLFRYGSRYGNHNLRTHLNRKLASHMITASERQIMTTHGGNHGLDLIIRRYVSPGDPVLVEEPGYYPLFGKLQLQGARMIGIPRLPDGPDIDCLEEKIRHERARIFFVQSCGQNPTGSDISAEKARRIAQLAASYDLLVVEDDALADFKRNSSPKISAVDQLRNTLYVGSFSKSLSASLRAGFIAGDISRIEELADIKMLLHVSGSEYSERILDVILTEGHFLRHVAKLQERVRHATSDGIGILKDLGAELFCEPEQALYLWARFPGIDDMNELTLRLLPKGVVLAPGSIFMLNPRTKSPWTRLNVGYLQDPLFIESIRSCM